jgi:hypothetical protein
MVKKFEEADIFKLNFTTFELTKILQCSEVITVKQICPNFLEYIIVRIALQGIRNISDSCVSQTWLLRCCQKQQSHLLKFLPKKLWFSQECDPVFAGSQKTISLQKLLDKAGSWLACLRCFYQLWLVPAPRRQQLPSPGGLSTPLLRPRPIAPNATDFGPLATTAAEYRFPATVDPDIISDRFTEIWAVVHRPVDLSGDPIQ